MRRIIALTLFLFINYIGIVHAEEAVPVDNMTIQEYNGHCGIWTTVESQAKLNFFINKFSITMKDVQDINGTTITWGANIFVPYSEKYLKELEDQGVKRETVATQKSDFIWPITNVSNISSTFGQRGGRFHTGADMPATKGTPIVAVMDGRVITTSYDSGLGNNVCIEHRDGFLTRYAHTSVILIKPGDYVKKGQIIALVGSTGNSTGNHLHFEIRYNDIPLNPLDFLPYKENLTEPHAIRNWK
jgi:murein DD-endopeptidase MepM/ murein hydrolase activator NlpD